MDICKYCKDHKFNKDEYKTFKNNIKTIATTIKSKLFYQGGVYFPIDEIIPYNANKYMREFIISELKVLGMEFRENNELYRITE